MTRRSARTLGTRTYNLSKMIYRIKSKRKMFLFLKRNNGNPSHSAVYAHILYGGWTAIMVIVVV